MKNILTKIKECGKGCKAKVFFEYNGDNQVVEGIVKSISKIKRQIIIGTIAGEWTIDFKDIVDIEIETNSEQKKEALSVNNKTEEISNKISAFIIEYPGSNSSNMIPLNKITGLLKGGDKCFIQAEGWTRHEISADAYNELLKYFEPVVIESREW